MAKKKLFGNQKEPRCETCAHGKLSANGESVLCVQGGALPLTHSCRRYQYDPLRRTPKRRPLLEEYSAADFALDEPIAEKEAPASAPAPEETAPAAEVASVPSHSTFDHLFEYLNTHDTPDADTILAILSKGYPSEEDVTDTPATQESEHTAPLQEQAAEATAALAPDASPDIAGDLERLDMAAVPAFALTPLADSDDPALLILSDNTAEEVLFLADTPSANEAPLSVDDLLFLPKGTPSDHDNAEHVGGGFTPLTGE